MQDINKISFKLLKTWCDNLCKLQVTQRKSKGVYGGILCDACAFIHGRCSDAVYPMVAMYEQTGDEKYLNCAKLLIQWHDNNLKSNAGYYFNDSFTTWRCTTLFYIIALCETLFDFGEALPPDLREQWTKDIVRMSAPLENDGIFFPPKAGIMPSVINYPVAYLTAMAAVGVLTGEQRYFTLAKKQEDNILSFVTESGWLFGENLDRKVSPMGIRGIDLGYNIEIQKLNNWGGTVEGIDYTWDGTKWTDTDTGAAIPDSVVIAPGEGLWVYNMTGEAVIFRIPAPEF